MSGTDRFILTLMAFVAGWAVGHVVAGQVALVAVGQALAGNGAPAAAIVAASAMFGGPVFAIVAALSAYCLVGVYNRRQS